MSIASTHPTFHRRPRLRSVQDAAAVAAPAERPPASCPAPPHPPGAGPSRWSCAPTWCPPLRRPRRVREPRPRRVDAGVRPRRAGRRGGDPPPTPASTVAPAGSPGHERHYEGSRGGRPLRRCRPGDAVVFTRNTTDAVNLLARLLPRDTSEIVFASEHHATLLPWLPRDTVRLPVPASVRDAEVLLETALAALPGTAGRPRSALVVLTGASNVTGEIWPVERLTAVARRHGHGCCSTRPIGAAPHHRPRRSSASTAWRSPATRCTPRSAPAARQVAWTGSTPPHRTWPVGGPRPG